MIDKRKNVRHCKFQKSLILWANSPLAMLIVSRTYPAKNTNTGMYIILINLLYI